MGCVIKKHYYLHKAAPRTYIQDFQFSLFTIHHSLFTNMKYLLFFFLLLSLHTQAQEKLTKNVKAPNIAVKDATGKKINLQQMIKGEQKVLVCFFRPVWCPICNQRTHELIERYEELKKKGIEVIAIYPSKQETMEQYVKDAKIPFTVIADPDELIYKEYAIERSMQKVTATLERSEIQKVYVRGQELYNGKVYPKDDEKYDALINADFLISANRVLEVAYYGEFIGDHLRLDYLCK